jgi:hypothetical protein
MRDKENEPEEAPETPTESLDKAPADAPGKEKPTPEPDPLGAI